MVFLIMNLIYILEELRMLMMTTTHLSRDFMKMLSVADDIKSNDDAAKGYGNQGYATDSKSSMMFKAK